VKLSINVTNFDYPGGPEALRHRLKTLAEATDAAGIDTIWVGDHLIQADPFADDADPMLEAYTTLGFLAAATTGVRLGTMVTAWITLCSSPAAVRGCSVMPNCSATPSRSSPPEEPGLVNIADAGNQPELHCVPHPHRHHTADRPHHPGARHVS